MWTELTPKEEKKKELEKEVEEEVVEETRERKQRYWFKVNFGAWDDDGGFDPESTFTYVEAWNAEQAIRKVKNECGVEDNEVIISVEYLGYPQV